MTLISSARIHEILIDCLFQEHEDPSNAVIVEGIMHKFGFHPGRINDYKQEIIDILSNLPDEFMREKGGGWSFLMACNDKEGHQWGEHMNMDELFSLGQAIGAVKFQLPRAFWSALPGGMPYVVVDILTEQEKNEASDASMEVIK